MTRKGIIWRSFLNRGPAFSARRSNDQVMEKVDEQGKIIGFSVMKISALKKAPLDLVLNDDGREGTEAWVRESSPRIEVFPGISSDPEVRFGKPCIAGTRVDVATVVGALAAGDSISNVQKAYGLTREQIFDALGYVAHLAKITPSIK